MAEKAGSDERIVTIPLRREFLKAPRAKRAKRAMKAVRTFLKRHMKAGEGKAGVSQKIHEEIWRRGVHRPPPRIRVKVRRNPDGTVRAMLPDEVELPREEKKAGIRERLGRGKGPEGTAAGKGEPEKAVVKESPTEPEKPDSGEGKPGTSRQEGEKPAAGKEKGGKGKF